MKVLGQLRFVKTTNFDINSGLFSRETRLFKLFQRRKYTGNPILKYYCLVMQ